MKIRRSGARAHHGYSSVDLSDCVISWDDSALALLLRSTDVPDFSTDAHHDYDVTLPVRDFNAMIDSIAKRVSAGNAEAILAALSPSLRGMLRIVAAEAGLIPPLPGPTGDKEE